IVTGIQQAALARVKIPLDERKIFHLFVDEFQNFVTSSFDEILSESGKYRLFLTMMHQTLKQIPDLLVENVFGNVGVVVAFRVSAENASRLGREMRRSNVVCRIRERNALIPIKQYLAYMKEVLVEKRDYYAPPLKDNQPFSLSVSSWHRIVYNDITRALETLTDPRVTLEAIAEISKKRFGEVRGEFKWLYGDDAKGQRFFPDMEFRRTAFPEPDDLTDLDRFHAYCKVDRASNVFKFKTVPAPAPDDRIRQAILDRMRRRAEKRVRQRAENIAVTVESSHEESLYDETDRIDDE
ncbi:MAG: TraM recognition domain-containing protein, partial [Deltaproteobacteria bacterium]|nr:TraM recognition domain-containing protein [Deltaproteobacteria bacterium]